jgi:putative flippase GtrA
MAGRRARVAVVSERLRQMWTSGLLGQLMRFGIAGGLSTLVYMAVYLPLTIFVFPRARAVLAVPPSFVVAVTAGYFLHSMWSFKGQGTREGGMRQKLQFVGVQGSGLLLNAAITWFFTTQLHTAAWVPLIPAICCATVVTFLLNRFWVFG